MQPWTPSAFSGFWCPPEVFLVFMFLKAIFWLWGKGSVNTTEICAMKFEASSICGNKYVIWYPPKILQGNLTFHLGLLSSPYIIYVLVIIIVLVPIPTSFIVSSLLSILFGLLVTLLFWRMYWEHICWLGGIRWSCSLSGHMLINRNISHFICNLVYNLSTCRVNRTIDMWPRFELRFKVWPWCIRNNLVKDPRMSLNQI